MPGDNAGVGDAAAHKADLIRQFASTSDATGGGLIAQLSNNPFFTAVSCVRTSLQSNTDTILGLWAGWLDSHSGRR
jgi:hypothetical protein